MEEVPLDGTNPTNDDNPAVVHGSFVLVPYVATPWQVRRLALVCRAVIVVIEQASLLVR